MKIIVGSMNPVKIEAVKRSFESVYPGILLELVGCSAESGVSEQPIRDAETQLGANIRVQHCRQQYPDADFWVGLEGGCLFDGDDLEVYAWMHIESRENTGKARTSSFILPAKVAELVKQGMELGQADDIVFKQKNSKQNNGAVGLLTRDLITRSSYYEQALILALIPFIHPELY